MAVYCVTGKLGTGKTKFCVWQAQRALRMGRRVASNVDLRLEHLVPELRSAEYWRIPDKPTAADLAACGHGNPDSYDEDRNGVMILDELGSWLNARAFQDKDRSHVIDWLIHARKHGWDVYLIVQSDAMIDKQVREALVEYHVRCMRLDKVRVPIFGSILGILHPRLAYMPRLHMATARVGYGSSVVVAERWHFRGDDLHRAYDTRQIFVHEPGAVSRRVVSPLAEHDAPARRGLFSGLRPGGAHARSAGAPLGRQSVPKPKRPWVQAVIDREADRLKTDPDRAWQLCRVLALADD